MHVVIERKPLTTALAWHTTGPSLRLLRVTIQDENTVVFESCTDEVWRKTRVPATEVKGEPGESTIFSAARLVDQTKAIKSFKTVVISRDGSSVKTKVGRSEAFNPVVMEIPRYWSPSAPLVEVASVDLEDFRWMIKAAAAAAAKAKTKADEVSKGVLLRVDPNGSVLATATDNYRLVEARSDCMASEAKEYLVQPDDLVSALTIFQDPVNLMDNEGHLGISDGVSEMLVRGLAGKPRSTDQVIARCRAVDPGAVVATQDLIEAIASSGLGQFDQIELTFSAGVVTVANRTDTADTRGRTETEVDAAVHGDLVEETVTLRGAYLAEMAKSSGLSQIDLRWAGKPRQPLILTVPEGSENEQNFIGMIALVNR